MLIGFDPSDLDLRVARVLVQKEGGQSEGAQGPRDRAEGRISPRLDHCFSVKNLPFYVMSGSSLIGSYGGLGSHHFHNIMYVVVWMCFLYDFIILFLQFEMDTSLHCQIMILLGQQNLC